MCEGYVKAQEEKYRVQWESMRWATFHLLNIQIDKRHKLKRLTDLVRFPWEKSVPNALPTREDFDRMVEMYGRTLA